MPRFDGPYRVVESHADWYDEFFSTMDMMILVRDQEGNISHVLFRCPCANSGARCGSVRLPVTGSNGWSFVLADGVPTIAPSIRQLGTCYGHYFIENGMVRWCDDSGNKP